MSHSAYEEGLGKNIHAYLHKNVNIDEYLYVIPWLQNVKFLLKKEFQDYTIFEQIPIFH